MTIDEEFKLLPKHVQNAIKGFWDYPVGPFTIPSGIDIETWKKFTYGIDFPNKVVTPVASVSNGFLIITCTTEGSTVKYKKGTSEIEYTYTTPIEITETITYHIWAEKQGLIKSDMLNYEVTKPYGGLCFTALENNVKIHMVNNTSNRDEYPCPNIRYSIDGKTWNEWNETVNPSGGYIWPELTLSNIGDKLYFYGENPNGFTTSPYNISTFKITGLVTATGDIMSLITKNGTNIIPQDSYCCFRELFYGCDSLTTTPDLTATKLSEKCYNEMFSRCLSLTETSCLNIDEPIELVDECFRDMFSGCRNLNSVKVNKIKNWMEEPTNAKNWLIGTSINGTFYKHIDTEIPIGWSGIPEDWEVINFED